MVLSGTATKHSTLSGAHWNFGNSRRIPYSLALKNAPSLTSRRLIGVTGTNRTCVQGEVCLLMGRHSEEETLIMLFLKVFNLILLGGRFGIRVMKTLRSTYKIF
jgi:hypothetical protein